MNPKHLNELRRIHSIQGWLETIETLLAKDGDRSKRVRAEDWDRVGALVTEQLLEMEPRAETKTLPLPLDSKSA